jgi:hypothetical protein
VSQNEASLSDVRKRKHVIFAQNQKHVEMNNSGADSGADSGAEALRRHACANVSVCEYVDVHCSGISKKDSMEQQEDDNVVVAVIMVGAGRVPNADAKRTDVSSICERNSTKLDSGFRRNSWDGA